MTLRTTSAAERLCRPWISHDPRVAHCVLCVISGATKAPGYCRRVPEVSLYLSEDIKSRVAEAARAHGVSEDDYMREAIKRVVAEEIIGERPRPSLPRFRLSDEPLTSERIDEILAEGFGRD
jgi:hypothetical protein